MLAHPLFALSAGGARLEARLIIIRASLLYAAYYNGNKQQCMIQAVVLKTSRQAVYFRDKLYFILGVLPLLVSTSALGARPAVF